MAAPSSSGQFKPSRYFIVLGAVLVVLYGLVFGLGKTSTPKLGLDLQGGTSLTMVANQIKGGAPVTGQNLSIARDIIDQRVNSLGVNDAQVVVQGSRNIVVSVAGHGADTKNLDALTAQAKLDFRQVLNSTADQSAAALAEATASASPSGSAPPTPAPSASGTPAAKPSKSSGSNGDAALAPAPSASAGAEGPTAPSAAPSASATDSASASPSASAAGTDTAATGSGITPLADVKKKLGTDVYTLAGSVTDPTQWTEDQVKQLAPFGKLTPADVAALPPSMQFAVPTISCKQLNDRVAGVITTDDAEKAQVVSCDPTGTEKYLLDAVKVFGSDVSSASFGYDLTNYQGWYVSLSFKGKGPAAWSNLTKAMAAQYTSSGTAPQVAIVLDNVLQTAPTVEQQINGPAIISGGGMTKDSAKLLSTQLKFGALPVSFTPLTTETVSATLGLQQMKAGLLAGAIGLALVILYCLFYYRLLGLVVIASLGVSSSLIYALVVLMGRSSSIGFTLSLAGIAGFIVAIGVTADSFVVFFERIKDEVREGRSGRSAVPRAWKRARRTILTADTVSFLAAAVLYFLASGEIRGFAFTLGMSTIIDVIVVFLFTHPLVSVISGSKAFTSPRTSGLGELRKPSAPTASSGFGAVLTKES